MILQNEAIKARIIDFSFSTENFRLIHEFKKSTKENELLFFLKPEFFHSNDRKSINLLLDLILEKINKFDIGINGIAALKGEFLRGANIIEKHYGFINKMSVSGSKIVCKSDLAKIKQCLDLKTDGDLKILGGHEVMKEYKSVDEEVLRDLWYSKQACRMGEGFYAQHQKIDGEDVILINGFHPGQIKHYTGPESKVVLFLLSTDTDWSVVRNDFVGDTFPEKAAEGSIRATFLKNSREYNIKTIDVANNFVHASSGPFDALFEICNFVGNLEGINYCKHDTNIYNLMTSKYNLDKEDYEACLDNPVIKLDDSSTDLFTITKNKNTFDAIGQYVKYFKRS
jgi:nucleoside diphosphate kinase